MPMSSRQLHFWRSIPAEVQVLRCLKLLSRPKAFHLAGERLDEAVHCLFLLLNRLHKFELRAAAIEVMALAMHFEVRIAGKEIREKADPDLEGDQFA